MQKLLRSFFITVLMGFFTVASAQLPPKVIADKYRIQVRQLLEEKDYIDALNMVEKIMVIQKKHSLTLPDEFYFKNTIKKLLKEKRYIALLNIMERILVLQKEHSLTLPDEFHFQYAQIAFSTGFFQTAVRCGEEVFRHSRGEGHVLQGGAGVAE